jgi:hypothetical protein
MVNVPNQERIDALLENARSKCNVSNALLIFRVDQDARGEERTVAYLLNKDKIVARKTAYVLVDPETDYLSMAFTPAN